MEPETETYEPYDTPKRRRIPDWAIIVVLVMAVIVASIMIWRIVNSGSATQPDTPGQQSITIDAPAPATAVGSPIVVTGQTAQYPTDGTLNYRISAADGSELAAGEITVTGEPGQPTTFEASIEFAMPGQSGITLEISDQNPQTGETIVTTSVDLTSAAVASPVPDQQAIIIETPPSGTQVNSPVVITGRTNQYPLGGVLHYRVVSDTGNELGVGQITVTGSPEQPATFNASIGFRLPPAGGTITIELTDRDTASGVVNASTSINLTVATAPPPATEAAPTTPPSPTEASPTTPPPATTPAPTAPPSPVAASPTTPPPPVAVSPTALPPEEQSITIEAPAEGSSVSSPLTVAGRTVQYPFDGNLVYRVLSPDGTELSTGTIPVTGTEGQPSIFNTPIELPSPPENGQISIEVADRDATTGITIAATTVNLVVEP